MTVRKSLEPGGQLGRYELLTPIAQGGMATVWAARQTGSHGFRKTVALKTMLPSLGDDPQFERMFLAEARLAMRVHHPNIAETLDLGEEDGLLYLVMEWIDGESLSTLLKAIEGSGVRFPIRLALHVCSRASRGLHAAHEVTDDDDQPVGIVHRDVSPQNLMISYDGHVKVVDFGVAKGQTEGMPTQVGQFKGKVPYMAPEQASGEGIDRRTDVFAMGTLLYRLTVGKHPFLGANQGVTMANVVSAEPMSPQAVHPDFPPELEAVIRRCLAKSPRDRYASMAALADELDALLVSSGMPVTDDELGATIKRHLGEVRKRRREAMRDAARALGWAMQTSESHPRVTVPNPQSLTPSVTTGGSLDAHSVGSGSFRSPQSRQASTRGRRLVPALVLAGASLAGALVAFALTTPSVDTPASAKSAPASTPEDAGPLVPVPTATAEPRDAPPVAAPSTDPPAASAATETAKPSARGPSQGRGGPRPKPTASASTGNPPPRNSGSWGTGPDMGF